MKDSAKGFLGSAISGFLLFAGLASVKNESSLYFVALLGFFVSFPISLLAGLLAKGMLKFIDTKDSDYTFNLGVFSSFITMSIIGVFLLLLGFY